MSNNSCPERVTIVKPHVHLDPFAVNECPLDKITQTQHAAFKLLFPMIE